MIDITSPNEIPKEGKAVVFVVFETAPCKKFINASNSAINEVLKDKENHYFKLLNTPEVKEALGITSMPTAIVYVDGEEKKRFSGHFYSRFEIAAMIGEGFTK